MKGQIYAAWVNFQEKDPWGQLQTSKFTDLVTSKSISISEKCKKLVVNKQILVTLMTPAIAMSSTDMDDETAQRKQNKMVTD